MNKIGRGLAAVVLAFCVGASTSCGSDSTAAEPEPVIDLGLLDVGGYRAEPKDYAPKEHDTVARAFEGQRLGAVLPLPSELDPRLRVNLPGTVHAFLEPGMTHESPMYTWLKKDGFDQDAPGFVTGFATSGQSETDEVISFSLSASVLLFETDQQASAAAVALARRGWHAEDEGGRVESVVSERFPAATLSWLPEQDVLASWYATGKFVIVAMSENRENRTLGLSDQDLLLSLTDNATTAIAARLSSFQPTPPDQISTMSLDPEGMMRVLLPRPESDSFKLLPGVYQRSAFLHLTDDPADMGAVLDEFGVDQVGFAAGWVFRTRDAEAAKEMLEDVSVGKYQVAVDPPAALPIAKCTTYRGPESSTYPFYCNVAFDRYVVSTWGFQLSEVHQRVSAQYAILARNK